MQRSSLEALSSNAQLGEYYSRDMQVFERHTAGIDIAHVTLFILFFLSCVFYILMKKTDISLFCDFEQIFEMNQQGVQPFEVHSEASSSVRSPLPSKVKQGADSRSKYVHGMGGSIR